MAGSQRKPECLIHWVNEQKWDVWPVESIPAELKFEGALGMIRYTNGKSYLGRILKISANKKEIEAEEHKLHEEIRKKKEKPSEAKRKSSRPTKAVGKTATTKEVNKALGERMQLSTPEKLAKKKASDAVKAKANAQLVTEAKEDEELFKSVSRDLFNSRPSTSSSSKAAHDVMSDDDAVSMSDDDIQHDNQLEHHEAFDDMNEGIETKENDCEMGNDVKEEESDAHIHEFRNPNTEAFLQFLLEQFRTEGKMSSSSTPTTKVYAKPLILPGQKMVRLFKNHSLRICKGSRNVLVLDTKSQKSVTNFIRKTLTQVYGKDQLMEMTAMGRKKDSLSISPSDMNTIYSFVTDICKTPLTWSAFTREVMKKLSATKSPSAKSKSESQMTPKSKTKAARSSASVEEITVVASPAKFQANTIVENLETSPSNLSSPAKPAMSPPLKRGLFSPMKTTSSLPQRGILSPIKPSVGPSPMKTTTSSLPQRGILSPNKPSVGPSPKKPTVHSEPNAQSGTSGTHGSWHVNNQWQGSQWGTWNGSQWNAYVGAPFWPPTQQPQAGHHGQYDPSCHPAYTPQDPSCHPAYTPQDPSCHPAYTPQDPSYGPVYTPL